MQGYRNLQQRWLDAYSDPRASIYTFSRCMTLSDLMSDGDYKLIIADLGTGSDNIKLKVYKGTSLITETTLLEIPTGVVTFHNDTREQKVPAIAVSSGSHVYVYKNMKPYFKFSLPYLDVNPLEQDLWLQARNDGMEPKLLQEMLQNIKNEIGFSNLSVQSQKLLSVEPEKDEEVKNVVKNYCPHPIRKQTVITCMNTLYKTSNTPGSISCLVLATENGFVHIVDTEAFTLLESVRQVGDKPTEHTVPVLLQTTGLYDVEYRIVILNRDGRVTLLRRGFTECKILLQSVSQPIDLCILPDSGNIVLATMNMMLECYTKKGRKQWDLKLPEHAMSMLPLPLSHLGMTLVAVAVAGGNICFYNGRQLVDTIMAADTVAGMIFGHFGQEEHTLILITIGGNLQIKMLKRTAQFPQQNSSANSVTQAHNLKLQIPKKTKLFLDQATREREDPLFIHQAFQRDLFRLRLDTARAFLTSLQSTNNPISNNTLLPLKLSAQVFGLGPTFKILLTLENMSNSADVTIDCPLQILFHFNEKLYEVSNPSIHVPMLVPGLSYKFETIIKAVTSLMISEEVNIFVLHRDSKPILSLVIYMPVCDVLPIEI